MIFKLCGGAVVASLLWTVSLDTTRKNFRRVKATFAWDSTYNNTIEKGRKKKKIVNVERARREEKRKKKEEKNILLLTTHTQNTTTTHNN